MSSRPRPKRNKAYRPKHIQVPVMPELQKEFMFASHGALAALRLSPNQAAFDQLAGMLNVLHVALRDRGRSNLILDSGMRALQDVANRIDRTGAVGLGKFELLSLENAVIACESIVKELDIVGLHMASQKVKFVEQRERGSA